MFYAVPEKVKALRVHRLLPVPGTTKTTEGRDRAMQELAVRLKDPEWAAATAAAAPVAASPEIAVLAKGAATAGAINQDPVETGIMAVAGLAASGLKMPAEAGAAKTDGGRADSYKIRESGDRVDEQRSASGASSGLTAERYVDRSSLPSLAEGDQYAVAELEAAPVGQAQARKSQGIQMPKGENPTSIALTRANDGADTGVFDISVPEHIAAILEQSAKKLNQGLGGQAESR
jgi:hypothetical protein